MSTFSIKESIVFGWETFKTRPWIFVGVEVLIFAISMLTGLPGGVSDDLSGSAAAVLGLLGFAISSLVSTLLDMGKTAFYLHAHNSVSEVDIKELWHPEPFWKYLGTSLLSTIIVIVGFFLLIVPGIILAIMFSFSRYIVIERELGPVEALKASAEVTKGHRWHLFKFGVALLGLNIIGLLCVVVGLLVTLPISFLAVVHVYRALTKEGAGVVAVEPEMVPVVA